MEFFNLTYTLCGILFDSDCLLNRDGEESSLTFGLQGGPPSLREICLLKVWLQLFIPGYEQCRAVYLARNVEKLVKSMVGMLGSPKRWDRLHSPSPKKGSI